MALGCGRRRDKTPEIGDCLMAKKKAAKRVTKSDFLRKAVGRNPDLELDQINRRWAKWSISQLTVELLVSDPDHSRLA
jgi:hypothetical protein